MLGGLIRPSVGMSEAEFQALAGTPVVGSRGPSLLAIAVCIVAAPFVALGSAVLWFAGLVVLNDSGVAFPDAEMLSAFWTIAILAAVILWTFRPRPQAST